MNSTEVKEVVNNLLLYSEYIGSKFERLDQIDDFSELSEEEQNLVETLLKTEFIGQLNAGDKPRAERENIEQAYEWVCDKYDLPISESMEAKIERHQRDLTWGQKPLMVSCYNCGLDKPLSELKSELYGENADVISNRHQLECPDCGKKSHIFISRDEFPNVNSERDVVLYNRFSLGIEYLPFISSMFAVLLFPLTFTPLVNTILQPVVSWLFVGSFLLFVVLEIVFSRTYDKWNRPDEFQSLYS